MKTRIDETNKMRKLMGLPLIKEQLQQVRPDAGSGVTPGGTYNKPDQPINPPNDPQPNQNGLMISYYDDPDGLQVSAKLKLSWDTLEDIGKVAVGFLSVLAAGLIKGEVKRIFRKRDIKFIIREIGTLMEQTFDKDTLKCFKKGFASVGKIEKLNDDNKTNKVRKVIGGCLANSGTNVTVDEFVEKLNPIILKWDAKSKVSKRALRFRNKKRNQ